MADSTPGSAACSRADFHEAMSMRCQECGYQPGPATAACTAGFRKLGRAALMAGDAMRHFVHTAFHHGEGQLPRTCEWCREALTATEERR